MEIFKKSFVSGLLFLFTSVSFAENRIEEKPELNRGRSMDESMPAEDCSREQKNALKDHCINEEEYKSLVKRNDFPVCTLKNGKLTLTGWFSCGCFDPRVKLLSWDKNRNETRWVPVREIVKAEKGFNLWSLNNEATFTNFTSEARPIYRTIQGPEKKPLIYLYTEEGNRLGLTTEHAVLLASGEMVAAKNLKEGNMLVSYLGKPLRLERIERRMIEEDVLNVLVDTDSKRSHMIFAEGIVVGDMAWQNSLQSELNAVAVRDI